MCKSSDISSRVLYNKVVSSQFQFIVAQCPNSCTLCRQTCHWLMIGMKWGYVIIFGLEANSNVSQRQEKENWLLISILLYDRSWNNSVCGERLCVYLKEIELVEKNELELRIELSTLNFKSQECSRENRETHWCCLEQGGLSCKLAIFLMPRNFHKAPWNLHVMDRLSKKPDCCT